MKFFAHLFKTPTTLYLEIKPNFFRSLLASGQIHNTDSHRLDLNVKQILWKLLFSLGKSKLTVNGNCSKLAVPPTETTYPSHLSGELDYV
ncbi:hypothetical protein GO003_025275 [Methylicorpusculum oleiharenae]|uniref:hypothetical protein n=1 Tax=Methylicorpusculum oleiharenae TaxID=1338687 RepID=UPI00135A7340|nr:hypothetical protein [Methylicorpusculum oleiharenae]MCD2453695.1 hypothetical protein [Methylicorpusculum oleiharenae]